ncbi:MAG: 4-hydroxy-tetrahydrodipicolinate synthase [Calditrichaeota bacterium]|nr:MAG: 4-hydroxy-tetrahydrodipicolinate synthase [Calditrichota bacterium]
MFHGTIVALVTPFRADGALNEEKVRELVQFHLDRGTSAIVPCGTTGESPTLSDAEKLRLFEIVVEEVNGRIPVIAGTGTNSTAKSIALTQKAREIGVDGALIITPYYNKPTQEGLYRHFRAVADQGGLPVVIYNVPGRTSVNLLPETVERLCTHSNIVAIKEASGNLSQISEIHRRCGEQITILSGDDGLTLPILSVGGKGVISVSANIVPDRLNAMIQAFQAGDLAGALRIHHQLADLHRDLFLETNPIPIKTAMNMMGFEVGGFRLPLCEMSPANAARLKKTLANLGLV